MNVNLKTLISDTAFLEKHGYKLLESQTESFLDIIWCIYFKNSKYIKIIREKGFYDIIIDDNEKLNIKEIVEEKLKRQYVNQDYYGVNGYKKMLLILNDFIKQQS